jgi:hypothetical protein
LLHDRHCGTSARLCLALVRGEGHFAVGCVEAAVNEIPGLA